jgi:hypothetical protein
MKHPKGYYLGSKIGEGAFGQVFGGFYPKLQLHACIKEIDLSESKKNGAHQMKSEFLK